MGIKSRRYKVPPMPVLLFVMVAAAGDAAAEPPPVPSAESAPTSEATRLPPTEIAATVAPPPVPSAESAPTVQPTPLPPTEIAAPVELVPGVGLTLSPGANFAVYDRTGRRYTTLQFARLVGDTATLTSLETQRDQARVGTAGLAGTGALVILASLLVATNDELAPQYDDYQPDPTLYDSEKEYVAAVDFEQGQYDKATSAWNEQRVGTALFLAGSGGILMVLAPFFGRDGLAKEDRPDKAYARETAQRWVEQYNAAHAAQPAAPTVRVVPVLGPMMAGISGQF